MYVLPQIALEEIPMSVCCPPPTQPGGYRPPTLPPTRTAFGVPDGSDPWHVWLQDVVVRFADEVKYGTLSEVAEHMSDSKRFRSHCEKLLSAVALLDWASLDPIIMRDFDSGVPYRCSQLESAIGQAINVLDEVDSQLRRRLFVLNALVVSSDMGDERRDDADA